MMNAAEIRALLVTRDRGTIETFTDLFRELGVDMQPAIAVEGIPEELGRTKYEALILDYDEGSGAPAILDYARKIPSNRTAVVFAVSSDAAYRQQALAQGANFVFERPFILAEIRNVLRAAYDLMIRERRRYFRCAAELPILLVKKTSGTDLRCTTINVSSSGMALATPSSLTLGEEVEIVLLLQGAGLTIRASGAVVWDDKHGKSGISFRCRTPQMQAELDSWLGAHFFELLSARGHHAGWLSP
jgi:DNA-binding response OmpR family regulator